MPEPHIIYKTILKRKIVDERLDPPGWILANPTTNKTTGFFRDKDLNKLILGKTIKRQITFLDGINGFEFKDTTTPNSTIGEMRDTEHFSLYPFRLSDELIIKLTIEKEIVTFYITLDPANE